MSSCPRLLLAARPHDLSVAPFDAFVTRRHRLMEALRDRYDLDLVLLRPHGDVADVREDYRPLVLGEAPVLPAPDGRLQRLIGAAKTGLSRLQDSKLEALVASSSATRAVTFGPWLDVAYQPVWARLPSLHVFEEDLRRMPENAPQSRQARAQRAVEDELVRHARHQPRVVVYISEAERQAARRRFARSTLLWWPFTLDPTLWPVATSTSTGERVVVVGQFAEPRNAEGLREVLDACAGLSGIPPIQLISHAGVHPCLDTHLATGLLQRLVDPPDLYSVYRDSLLTLVPAQRVTGIKTTVLQAWTAGSPVVCFPASARTLGDVARGATGVGETPVQVASLLKQLASDPAAREQLSAAGRAGMATIFDPGRRDAALLQALREMV